MAAAVIGGIVTAIGVASKVLKIYQFAEDKFGPKENTNDRVTFTFKIGLDGAGVAEGWEPMNNAGGNVPDIRVYNEHGEHLGRSINDKKKCNSGQDNCYNIVGGVNQQPTYALFSGNNDAICIAWIGVTWPGQDKYAWVGNWGRQCDAPWYYSDIYLQAEGGAEKVTCTWLDGNGDQPTTGLQVHWPEYRQGFAKLDTDPNYYCNNPATQHFYYGHDPVDVFYWGPRGELKNSDKNWKHPRALLGMGASPISADPSLKKREAVERLRRSQAGDTRLIKSKVVDHSAKELCNSPNSVGPSFVSKTERLYCHMPTKTLYPYCDDIETGSCWEDDTDTVILKGEVNEAKRAALPESNFSNVVAWGEDDE